MDGWILGSQEFAERIRQQLQPARRRLPNEGRRSRLQVGELVAAVCDHYQIAEPQLAWCHSRHPARAVLALLAHRYMSVTLGALTPLVGVACAGSVPYLIRRAASASQGSAIARAIDEIERHLGLS